jgi:hypothetical protein
MFDLLAAERSVTVDEIKSAYGGLIFFGLFILACIGAAIWWLRR